MHDKIRVGGDTKLSATTASNPWNIFLDFISTVDLPSLYSLIKIPESISSASPRAEKKRRKVLSNDCKKMTPNAT